MLKSIYTTADWFFEGGHGGSVVSYHESKAFAEVSKVQQIYGHLQDLMVEDAYPHNPLMYDHFISTLMTNVCGIQAAHFFGAYFPSCAKRLEHAIVTFTITGESHTLGLEEEHRYFHAPGDIYGGHHWVPEKHHENEHLFKYCVSGLKVANKIITPSKNGKTNLLQYGIGLEEDNIVVIPFGTDIPISTTPRDIPFKVSTIGRCGGVKGHRYLARSWRGIHTGIKGAIHFMGFGTDWIQDLWLTDNFQSANHKCLGEISEDQKRAELLSTSVYVQPSVNEGWGMPVGEAMAYGIPVIVTNETGAADMVTDGLDGFIIPIRDPDAISDKILYFYDNPSEIKRMGDNARKKALDYSWDKIEERYKMFWTKLYSEERL